MGKEVERVDVNVGKAKNQEKIVAVLAAVVMNEQKTKNAKNKKYEKDLIENPKNSMEAEAGRLKLI